MRVVLNPMVPCGSCCYCRTGRINLYENVLGIYGYDINGGFAEYVKASTHLVEISETTSLLNIW